MKKTFLLVVILLTVLAVNNSFAQKKEKKKSKKELAQEALLESAIKPYQERIEELENKISLSDKEMKKLDNEIKILEEENKLLQTELNELSQMLESGPVGTGGGSQASATPEGVVFKIQLGAYNNSVTGVFSEDKYLQAEKADGRNKYVIGHFNYEEAKKAVADFKKLGIKGAWLVPYRNGQRISDAEAEQLLNFSIRDQKRK